MVKCYRKFLALFGRRFGWLLVVGLLAVGGVAQGEPLRVVVATPALGALVERVGDGGVSVEVLAGAGQNHETFAPSPRQLARVAGADLYLSNDLPFEQTFLPRLKAVAPQLPVVDTVAGVERIGEEAVACCDHHSPEGHAHDHGHAHSHGPVDPHLWLSPAVLRAQVAVIAEALGEHLGDDAGVARRAAALIEELDALEGALKADLKDRAGAAFLINHPALGYFARDFGLQQVSLEAEGRQPSPARIDAELRRAREAGVRVVFVQAGFSRSAAGLIARELGVPAVEFDPMAGDPLAEMRRIAGAFRADG